MAEYEMNDTFINLRQFMMIANQNRITEILIRMAEYEMNILVAN